MAETRTRPAGQNLAPDWWRCCCHCCCRCRFRRATETASAAGSGLAALAGGVGSDGAEHAVAASAGDDFGGGGDETAHLQTAIDIHLRARSFRIVGHLDPTAPLDLDHLRRGMVRYHLHGSKKNSPLELTGRLLNNLNDFFTR